MFSNWAHSTFGALSNREYRVLFIGTTVSMLGFMMMMVVQSVVAFDLTGKNGSVGLVSLGMGVAMALVSPFGGAIADRVSKKMISLIGQAVITVAFATIALLIMTDVITIWMLALSSLAIGLSFAFIGPARQAWIGEVLQGPMLSNGVALQQVTMNATRILGPVLAGVLVAIAFIGTGGAYVVMALLAGLVVMSFLWMPGAPPSRKRDESVFADLKLGLQHVWERPRLRLLVATFAGVVLAGYAYQVILPGYLSNALGRDPERDLGVIFAVSAVGGLILSVSLVSKAGTPNARWYMFIFGGILGGGLMLAAIAPTYITALGAMVIVGAASSGFQLLNNAIIMQETDPRYFGRVMSLTMLAFGFNGIAAYPYGALADAVGERATLFAMGTASVVVVILGALALAAINRQSGVSTDAAGRPPMLHESAPGD